MNLENFTPLTECPPIGTQCVVIGHHDVDKRARISIGDIVLIKEVSDCPVCTNILKGKWKQKDHPFLLCQLALLTESEQVPEIDPHVPAAPLSYNVGDSDYSKHKIQPWHIWKEYELNPWDADIIKRVLRTKKGESRAHDYKKIIHICQYMIAELEARL